MGTRAKRFDNLNLDNLNFDNLNSDFVTEVQSSLWSNYLDYLSHALNRQGEDGFFTTPGEFPIDVRGAEVK
jgi:hypothetical protein